MGELLHGRPLPLAQWELQYQMAFDAQLSKERKAQQDKQEEDAKRRRRGR